VNILIDLDGVTADLVGAICKHFGKQIPTEHIQHPYDLAKLLDINPVLVIGFLKNNESLWASLNPYPHAKQMVDHCSMFGHVYFCTYAKDESALTGKLRWVRKHFPRYEDKIIFAQDKQVMAHNQAILIDDCEANVEAFVASDGHAITFPRPWNHNYKIKDSVGHTYDRLAKLINDYQIVY
jgi:5'(3')-deoxyribonucleotidase